MGFRSLIEVNHDTFDRLCRNPDEVINDLGRYVASGCREAAQEVEDNTHGALKVIAMRDSSSPYYVGAGVPGFPTQLPYDDQLDADMKAWDATVERVKAWLGGKVKLRTVSQLQEIITRLMSRKGVADAQIAAHDGAYLARRKLEDTRWQPSRADYEGLKNRLANIEQILGDIK